jgi:hypothetical protein
MNKLNLYPLRSSIYQPNLIMGLREFHWLVMGVIGLVCLTVPLALGLHVGPLPLGLLTGVGSVVVALGFFKWSEVGRRKGWLELKFAALTQARRQERRRAQDRRQGGYL